MAADLSTGVAVLAVYICTLALVAAAGIKLLALIGDTVPPEWDLPVTALLAIPVGVAIAYTAGFLAVRAIRWLDT